MPQQNPLFFWLGVILGCARVHPLRASHVCCVYLGRGLMWLTGVLRQTLSALVPSCKLLDCTITRNLLVLAAFGLLTEAAAGPGAASLVVLFLAAKLPWAGGNPRVLRRLPLLTGLTRQPPPFDLAAFEASLAPLADAELRQLADGFQAQQRGSLPDRQRRERTLRVRVIYRTLDQRRAARRDPQGQKNPGQPVGGPGKKKGP